MPSVTIKKPVGKMTDEEKDKITQFFRKMKGKVIFPEKVKKAEENLRKAKLI